VTRDEFIDGYMARSGLPAAYRTEDGFSLPSGWARRAEPCACGEEMCEGWRMVSTEEDAADTA
jgi:hypothetical protein